MNQLEAASAQETSVHLSRREVRRTRWAIGTFLPLEEEPHDYEDCLLLGLWNHLGHSRSVPADVWRVFQARRAAGPRPAGSRERAPRRRPKGELGMALARGAMVHHVWAALACTDWSAGGTSEEILIDEGIIGVLSFVPHPSFVGDALVAHLVELEALGA